MKKANTKEVSKSENLPQLPTTSTSLAIESL